MEMDDEMKDLYFTKNQPLGLYSKSATNGVLLKGKKKLIYRL